MDALEVGANIWTVDELRGVVVLLKSLSDFVVSYILRCCNMLERA